MKINKRLFHIIMVALILISLPHNVFAQKCDTIPDNEITTSVKMLGIGTTNVLDTYISPEKYTGNEIRYISLIDKMKIGSRWSTTMINQGDVSYTKNRSADGDEISGMYNFAYGCHYNWSLCSGNLRLQAGGLADLNIGFIYNTRSGNNPAEARCYLNITPSGAAEYDMHIHNHIYMLRYSLQLPLVGVMFSPNYGQSYYEIFSKGDYDHNIVPTTFISSPSFRQMLTVDFNICHTTLRVGYLGDYQQSKVNNLKTHIYTNSLVIGIVKRFQIFRIRR